EHTFYCEYKTHTRCPNLWLVKPEYRTYAVVLCQSGRGGKVSRRIAYWRPIVVDEYDMILSL
ncbi:MAG: hypothetical protein PHS55_00900, partial [Firmicutes bacterium]|nr:hypothetical protein [Bacillota bacterium]